MFRFEREYVSFKPRSAPGSILKSSIAFLQVIENQKYWFAARTRDKQEFAVRKSLDKLKSEEKLDLDYYLPTRIVISQLKYRRKRSEVPVIRNLIFICATKQTACDISNVYNVQLFYMKDLFTHSMLVVPNKQMEDFMREKEAQIKERLLKNMQEIHGIKVIKICAPIPAESIKNIAFQLRGEITENLCFVAGTINEGKPMLTVMLSDNLVAGGLKAGNLVKEAAKLIQGGGGGQPHFATAGGKNIDGLNAAIEKVLELAGI